MKDMTITYSDKDIERFWKKVEKSSTEDCWLWTGGRVKGGYGKFKFNKNQRQTGAHRFSLMLSTGEFFEELYACHTCDNPPCVNPNHLFWGTARENNTDTVIKGRWRGGNANKTKCLRGHDFDIVRPNGTGRDCSRCIEYRKNKWLDKQGSG